MTMTADLPIPTAILLMGHGHQDAEQAAHFQHLADRLAERLQQVVIPCPLDRPGQPVLEGTRAGLARGAVKFVALPLFLSPAEYRANHIADAIARAARRWSFLTFHVSPSPDCWRWVDVLTASVRRCTAELAKASVILARPACLPAEDNPEADADLAKLGHLLQRVSGVRRVELASVDELALNSAIAHCQLYGQGRIVVVSAFPCGGPSYATLRQHVGCVATDAALTLAAPLCREPALVDVLEQQYHVALSDSSLLPISWDEVRRQVEASSASHRPQTADCAAGAPDDAASFQDLAGRINAILPPRYQNGARVSAAPMAAAELPFDDDGQVRWDQTWGGDDPDSPFCELALAGGPPHRGELLEPVPAAACAAAPGRYAAVLAELARGIGMVAGLETVSSASPGWVGVQCESEEMAIWLLRAIIVENVMVRREGAVLYLPAGPHFTVQGEIKNVVTVVAKTVHYWQEHVMSLAFPLS